MNARSVEIAEEHRLVGHRLSPRELRPTSKPFASEMPPEHGGTPEPGNRASRPQSIGYTKFYGVLGFFVEPRRTSYNWQ